jgi:transaldolase
MRMVPSADARRWASALAPEMHAWVLQGFTPRFGKLADSFESDARWRALGATGTELWLDTGDQAGAGALWTREFKALTTNNTLLNKEVQRGQYDDLVKRTAARLRQLAPELSTDMIVLEIAFVLNAYHGLRLVERFDAFVSVEEHTDLAHDAELAVLYGKRLHAVCPQRFLVKLPLTPAGLVGMRRLRQAGVPINFTLGFSARHNYVAARFGNPDFVNVFLGRLSAFVSDEKLGTGAGVGEKATAASQEAMAALRRAGATHTRQIAASMRNGAQVWSLAGVDVMTMPLAVAQEYRDAARAEVSQRGPAAADFDIEMDAAARRGLRFDVLWEISSDLRGGIDALLARDVDGMSPGDVAGFLRAHGAADLFPEWSAADLEALTAEGKIPRLSRWRRQLESGAVGFDALINAAGLCSFATDQKALDDRVRSLI